MVLEIELNVCTEALKSLANFDKFDPNMMQHMVYLMHEVIKDLYPSIQKVRSLVKYRVFFPRFNVLEVINEV